MILCSVLVVLAALLGHVLFSNHNLFTNSSLEAANNGLPKGWSRGSWGKNSANYAYLDSGHTGSHSTKVTLSSYASGAAYWNNGTSKVKGGQLYDFQDYYKSDIASEIDATLTMKDDSEKDIYLGTAFASPGTWTKFETQFRVPPGATKISFYHDINSVGFLTTDDFSLHAFSYEGFKRPLVSITDDDGFANFYQNGVPVLKKYDLPATAYIISGYLGSPPYMTNTQLEQLPASAIEIGSHSVNHADLSTKTASTQAAELTMSRTALQKLLGFPITDYAAPYGAYNQQIATKATRYYQSYRGTQPGYNAMNNFDAMNLQVQNITSKTTTVDVRGWLRQAYATNTWLVLVYHEISTTPLDSIYNTTPADFDAQMRAVQSSGIITKNVSNALKETTAQLKS